MKIPSANTLRKKTIQQARKRAEVAFEGYKDDFEKNIENAIKRGRSGFNSYVNSEAISIILADKIYTLLGKKGYCIRYVKDDEHGHGVSTSWGETMKAELRK